MVVRNFFLSTMVLSLLSIQLFAQGICVPETFRVNSVSGKVMAHLEGRDEAFEDVSVKIFKKGKSKKAIKETKTSIDGLFDFSSLKSGKYNLVVSYPKLSNFYLDLVVSSENPPKNEQITIWLGADFLKPCSGSYAELKEK
jgi:hypothetical protein